VFPFRSESIIFTLVTPFRSFSLFQFFSSSLELCKLLAEIFKDKEVDRGRSSLFGFTGEYQIIFETS